MPFRLIPTVLAAFGAFSSASVPGAAQNSAAASAAYTVLTADRVGQLRLVPTRSVVLGDSLPDSPSKITDVAVTHGRIYILDGQINRLLVYTPSGHLIHRSGGWGSSVGQFETPRRLVFVADTLLVVDAAHHGYLASFDLTGNSTGGRRLAVLEPPIAASAWSDTLLVAWIVSDVGTGPHLIVTSFNARGGVIGNGCKPDPRYSSKGMVGAFALSEVSSNAMHVLCSQFITPVIQILDHSARTVGAITWAPPFYVAPRDEPVSLNAQDIQQFRSTWTSHERSYPVRRGFLSIYSRYDVGSHRMRYYLFGCPEVNRADHCLTIEAPGRPASFIEPNTLVVERSRGPTEPLILDFFRFAL